MNGYIKEPRRAMHLVLDDLINALGGYKRVAAACLVAPVSVSKWKEDPGISGQVIPVVHLQTLLVLVGENLHNLAIQNLADELIQDNFLNLYFRRCIPEERVFQIVEMLQGKPVREPEKDAVNE